MNVWTGIGHLGKDNELKYTTSGTAILNQSIAVRRNFKNKQTDEYETDWINLSMFGKTAENFANFTRKGSKVGVEGRIQTRNYDNQQGQKVFVTEIVVEQFHLLESKASGNQQAVNNQQQSYQQPQYQPQQNQSYGNQGYNNNFGVQDSTPVDISEDQLPF